MHLAPYPEYDEMANCLRVDPETFFPPRTNAELHAEAGRKVCKGDGTTDPCPFLSSCFNYALTHAVEGVWGGKSDHERAAIRRKYRIKADPLQLTGWVKRSSLPRNGIPHGTAEGVERHRRKYEAPCPECQTFVDDERAAS